MSHELLRNFTGKLHTSITHMINNHNTKHSEAFAGANVSKIPQQFLKGRQLDFPRSLLEYSRWGYPVDMDEDIMVT